MNCVKYSITIFAVISCGCGVKVNLQGSLSFGKDVLDTLTHYMKENIPVRRSMNLSPDTDVLFQITKSTYLCRDLIICEGKLEQFINEYLTLLTKSVQAVFNVIIKDEAMPENDVITNLFEEDLKKLLRNVRRLLREANMKLTDKNKTYIWITIIKQISAMFQEAAIMFASDRLETQAEDNVAIQKRLMQKFILATVLVEGQYENKLCTNYAVCTKAYDCTKSLNTILTSVQELDGENIKIFIRNVAGGLADSKFYSHISETTANQFQIILNDMGYSDNVPTKDVLKTIQNAVEERLKTVKEHTYSPGGKDVELVHVILSDMDHFYSLRKTDPFHGFLTDYFEWVRHNTKLKPSILNIMNDISNQLQQAPEELQIKLIHEVRAFLELTVDPEN